MHLKYFFIIVCLVTLGYSQSPAQVSFTQTAKPIVKEEVVKYDSSVNFVGGNVKALLGQELYVIPKTPDRKRYGYQNFYRSYENTNSNFGDIKTYEKFADKTFIVEKVLPPFEDKESYHKTGTKDILKLKEKDGDQVYFYKYDPKYIRHFPFIILGFYEKEKKTCIGKQIVLKQKNWRESDKTKPIYDFKTGLEVKIDINDIWTVQELTVEDQYYTLSYIIINNKNETLSINLNSINDYIAYHGSTGPCALWYTDTLQKLKAQHPEYYEALMKSRVRTGMTEEMVRMAWGDPKTTRHTSYGDFWEYPNHQTLHFENGILKAFN